MKTTIIKNIGLVVMGILIALLAYMVYGVYVFSTTLSSVQEKADNGQTAYNCLNQGKCAYDIISKYHQALLENSTGE